MGADPSGTGTDPEGSPRATEWSERAGAFRAALERDEDDAAAHFGLGSALWWLGEPEASLRHWERAYVAARRRGDPAQATIAAVYLCLAYRMGFGNDAAARGWLGRAARLVAEHALDGLAGWVLLGEAHVALDAGRAGEAENLARQSLARARAGDEADLALCALSELGAALVEQGRVEEGAGLLDEAMAAALAGEGHDPDAVVLICCRTIGACSRAGEVERATQWIHAADGFHRRFGSPHLFTTCRIQYGAILLATGRWREAEAELETALRIGRGAEPALQAEALARLAELRVAQGRLDEGTRLLAGHEDQPASARPLAQLHLARGEALAAAAVLRRRLRDIDAEGIEAAALTDLLAEAASASGVALEEGARSDVAAPTSDDAPSGLLRAYAERTGGRTAAARGRVPESVVQLERATAIFGRLGLAYEAARTRLLLARVLAGSEPEVAAAEARVAVVGLDALGARRDADAAAALLRSLGGRVARGGSRTDALLTRREEEVLTLLGEGLSNRAIADRLFITRKTVEHHVASVLAKTGLGGRGEAAAYAVRRGVEDSRSK